MHFYFKSVGIHFRSEMEYKASFIFSTLGQFLGSFNILLGTYFMMQRFHTVAGFTLSEVMLCYGINLMQFTLVEMFARGFDVFPILLGNGEFDRMLARPKNILLQVICSRFDATRIASLLQSIALFVYGLVQSDIIWNVQTLLTLIGMLIGGFAVYAGLFLIYAALCFFTTEGLEAMNILTYGGKEHCKYPIGIYGKRLLLFCTYVVPYALMQYYPLLYLLGRGKSIYMVFPLLAIIFLLPAYILWRIGLSKYKSTGS